MASERCLWLWQNRISMGKLAFTTRPQCNAPLSLPESAKKLAEWQEPSVTAIAGSVRSTTPGRKPSGDMRLCVEPHRRRSVFHGKAGEVSQFDQLRCNLVVGPPGSAMASSSISNSSGGTFVMRSASSKSSRLCVPPRFIRSFRRAFSTRIRRMASAAAAKKWPRAVPVLGLLDIDEPEVRLVHQGGGLQRLAGLLVVQPGSGQFPQLLVDQWQQLLGRRGIAGFDVAEDAGDVGQRRGFRRVASALIITVPRGDRRGPHAECTKCSVSARGPQDRMA